jgi:hypothetical protein
MASSPASIGELYTDRGSHYFFTPEAGGKVSKTQLTQVGRALKQLGIGHIAAYSPEARGRCERAFRTLQDRLPKELELAGITTVEAANRFIREVYLGEHNARFAVPAEGPASTFVVVPEALWRDVLSIQEERRVGPTATRGQLRPLAGPPAADPADPAAAPPGAGDRPGARLSRRHGGHLQRATAPGQLRAGGARGRRGPGRVTAATRPALWICGQRSAFPTTPQGQPQQRPHHALPIADKITRALQPYQMMPFALPRYWCELPVLDHIAGVPSMATIGGP